jgi:hypothetical protein
LLVQLNRFRNLRSVLLQLTRPISSIYQDVALHTEDEFLQMAPPEAKTPEILGDEHLLLLTRLKFELAERKRFVFLLRAISTY